MTPEKRAREVRNKLRDECLRLDNPGLVGGCGCSWCHAIESLLPPGSIILTPDEAEKMRRVAHEFTAWAEDWNDGTYAYYKSDGLMVACVELRSMLGGGS